MTSEYINPIPEDNNSPVEVEKNEQKTPKRITIEYQTAGKFEDISKKSQDRSGESVTG